MTHLAEEGAELDHLHDGDALLENARDPHQACACHKVVGVPAQKQIYLKPLVFRHTQGLRGCRQGLHELSTIEHTHKPTHTECHDRLFKRVYDLGLGDVKVRIAHDDVDPGVDEAGEVGIPAGGKVDHRPPAQHGSCVVVHVQEGHLMEVLLSNHDESVRKLIHLQHHQLRQRISIDFGMLRHCSSTCIEDSHPLVACLRIWL